MDASHPLGTRDTTAGGRGSFRDGVRPPPGDGIAARSIGLLKRVGIYALFIVGAYWLMAAFFSSWGDATSGRILWATVGTILIAIGFILQAEPVSEKNLAAASEMHLRIGGWWFAAGVLITAITYISASSNGGIYLVAWGPIAFGGAEVLQGLVQHLTLRRMQSRKMLASGGR